MMVAAAATTTPTRTPRVLGAAFGAELGPPPDAAEDAVKDPAPADVVVATGTATASTVNPANTLETLASAAALWIATLKSLAVWLAADATAAAAAAAES